MVTGGGEVMVTGGEVMVTGGGEVMVTGGEVMLTMVVRSW